MQHHGPSPGFSSSIDRRSFIGKAARSTLALTAAHASLNTNAQTRAAEKPNPPIIDTHMHVWADDPGRYPFPYPYSAEFKAAPHKGTVEMLIDDMDQHGCSHAVLVQVIYHGWDNRYVADCVRRFPKRLKAHGLIDPTDPKVADKLEYWVKEHGLHGMRFSPMYYQNGNHGGDDWITAEHTHRLWRMAGELDSVFNFFITPQQLPKLKQMVDTHRNVRVVIDHLSQMDLGAADPEPDFRLLLDMADYDNVWVKVSELTSVSKSGTYPFVDSYPYVKRVYETFGPDRLLFGTGYPGAARAAYMRPTLDREIDLIRNQMPFLKPVDREKILGRNAAKLWGFAVNSSS